MPYVSQEQKNKAKQYDLMTYLQCARPHELLRISGREYTTRTHPYLRISNGFWRMLSTGESVGGRSALDYLMKIEDYSFVDAVSEVLSACGRAASIPEQEYEKARPRARPAEKEIFTLPPAADSNDRVIQYLAGRGIDREIIDLCLLCGTLYESAEKHKNAAGEIVEYHNAVFCGWDATGEMRYAVKRGLTEMHFYGEAPGSDKRFGFRFGDQNTKLLAVFESAIDCLSHATLRKMATGVYNDCDRLALGGAVTTKDILPDALEEYLSRYTPEKILLCLDNDKAGIATSLSIQKILQEKGFDVELRPAPFGKDYNDFLRKKITEKRDRPKRTLTQECR